jgi:hypothetical protein
VCERGEVGRQGEFMAHAWKQRDISRSFPRRAGEASLCTPQALAPWKRLNRWYPLGLCEGCFDARAGQDLEGAQEINQRVFGSPGPVSGTCEQPIAPLWSCSWFGLSCAVEIPRSRGWTGPLGQGACFGH